MRITPTFGAASGHAGGIVATRDRSGAHLRARGTRTQPRTVIQTTQRARLGSMAGAWRALTPNQRTAWCTVATQTPWKNSLGQPISLSGYALFVSTTCKALNKAHPLKPITGAVIIEINGAVIAEIPGQVIQINGETIAVPA